MAKIKFGRNAKKAALSASAAVMATAMLFSVTGTAAFAKEADAEGEYYYTSEYSSRQAVLEAGRELSRQISGEGYVLLKNEGNTLPLKKGSNITVLGKNSVNPSYSGSGSGGGPSGGRVDLYQALEQTGFKVNPTLKAFYENTALSGANGRYGGGMIGRVVGMPTYETPVENYRAAEKRSFDVYDDAAIIFIRRTSGEGSDVARSSWQSTDNSNGRVNLDEENNPLVVAGRTNGDEHYLELDDNEKDMIKMAKASGFQKVVLVINSGNPMELDWVDSEELGVDAALWMGNPGQTGFLALGDVLNGDVNPSGHLTDTYAKDFTKSPTWNISGLGATGEDDGFYSVMIAVGRTTTVRGTYADYASAKAAADAIPAAEGQTVSVFFNVGTGNAWIVDANAPAAVSTHYYGMPSDVQKYPIEATANENGSYTVGTGSTATTYTAEYPYSYNRYVKYKDGIYVGYKYYETMYEELGASGDAWYESRVKYPFGYGMSYTQFVWETASSKIDMSKDKSISRISVKVTNTGSVAGKDVVQLYAAAPYESGVTVEKSAQTLIAYAKTDLLQPGESQIVDLSFKTYDLASWDDALSHDGTKGGYVLDAGEYTFSLRTDSHNDKDGVAPITYNLAAKKTITKDPTTGTTLESQFAEAMNVANGEDFDILTRADMAQGEEHVLGDILRKDTEEERKININDVQYLRSSAYLPETYKATATTEGDRIPISELDKNKDYYKTEMPKTAAENKKEDGTLYGFRDLIGVDPATQAGADLYQKVVENMTIEELGQLVGSGSHRISNIDSIGLPYQYQEDGPGGFNTQPDTMAFCNNIVIASTWNVELAEEMGELMGEVALWERIGGWYAPSVNIHRSEFAGRNFEYFAEDSVLSGDMVGAQIRGANRKGLMCLLKHFALNDQETDRGRSNDGACTYADEQTIREIYLRPFEIAVKEGGATGIMGSFNRIGNIWASAYTPLNREVLREEWGFLGAVVTDASSGQYMRPDSFIRGYTDYDLGTHTGNNGVMGSVPKEDGTYDISPTSVFLMQEAAKHILYASAHCNAINEVLGYIAEDGQFHTTNKTGTFDRRTNYVPLDLTDVADSTDVNAKLDAILAKLEEGNGGLTEADLETIKADIATLKTTVEGLETSDNTEILSKISALESKVAALESASGSNEGKGGCGGSIVGTALISGIALAGIAVVAVAARKRKNHN